MSEYVMLLIGEHSRGITFKVYVQPRSSVNKIVGVHVDVLKIKLTAPPVGGAANKMCIKFLSKRMGVPKSSLEILSGHTGRTKRLLFKFENGKFEISASLELLRVAPRICAPIESKQGV